MGRDTKFQTPWNIRVFQFFPWRGWGGVFDPDVDGRTSRECGRSRNFNVSSGKSEETPSFTPGFFDGTSFHILGGLTGST